MNSKKKSGRDKGLAPYPFPYSRKQREREEGIKWESIKRMECRYMMRVYKARSHVVWK